MKLPLDIPNSELIPLVQRLRQSGQRITNLQAGQSGYRILAIDNDQPRPTTQDLFSDLQPTNAPA